MYSALDLIAEKDSLKTQREPFLYIAQEVHEVVGAANADLGADAPLMDYNDTKDTTARRQAQFYANGLSSLAFPKHEEWFSAEPPMRDADESAKEYYHKVAEEMRLMLEESNWYDVVPLVIFEGGAYGTGLVKIGYDDRDGEVFFTNQCFGTYYIVEDHRQRLTAVYRDIKLTVEQLLGFLGAAFDSDDLPEKLKQALTDPKKKAQQYDFLHVVKRLPAGREFNGKGYYDALIFTESKTTLKDDYHEFMPFFIRRHARFGNWVYGWGCGWMALEDGHQASEASRLFEAFAARSTFPSVQATGAEEGEIRLGAGEITYTDQTSQSRPVAWAEVGDYRSVMELLAQKHRNIEEAFNSDLFKGLQDVTKQLTAMEVSMRESEKNQQLYPSALRLESETGKPMLDALYTIGKEQNRFPEPPDSVIDYENDPANALRPKFRLVSKITVSIRQQRVVKFAQWLEMFMGVLQQDPTLALKVNWEAVITDPMRDSGLPESWIQADQKFKELKAQVEAQQAAQLQAQQAAALAKATRDVGAAGQEGVELAQQAAQQLS